jgi:hypothetical protein
MEKRILSSIHLPLDNFLFSEEISDESHEEKSVEELAEEDNKMMEESSLELESFLEKHSARLESQISATPESIEEISYLEAILQDEALFFEELYSIPPSPSLVDVGSIPFSAASPDLFVWEPVESDLLEVQTERQFC